MTIYRRLQHVESGRVLLSKIRWCDSFGSKLRGFTFRRHLSRDEGLVLVEKSDNRVSSAIHMLFVFFDLGVIWVNDATEIVDTVVAKPWRLSYVPQAPARYVIEVHPAILQKVKVGEHVNFLERKA